MCKRSTRGILQEDNSPPADSMPQMVLETPLGEGVTKALKAARPLSSESNVCNQAFCCRR